MTEALDHTADAPRDESGNKAESGNHTGPDRKADQHDALRAILLRHRTGSGTHNAGHNRPQCGDHTELGGRGAQLIHDVRGQINAQRLIGQSNAAVDHNRNRHQQPPGFISIVYHIILLFSHIKFWGTYYRKSATRASEILAA